ncbi:MAG: hypothetical protein Q8P22_03885 [Chloroflexota bacterium]|nr:hypothetical protein [Chloroflexota bacterium]
MAALRVPLYANSIYLVLNSGVAAVLGFSFWVAVARLYSAHDVGVASGLISAVSLLAFLASFGLDQGLIRFLPAAGTKASRLLNSVFWVSGLCALAAAAVFLAGLRLWSPALLIAQQHPAYVVTFLGAVPALTLLHMMSAAFIGYRRASLAFVLGTGASVLRILLALALVSWFGVFGVFAAWSLALAAVVGLGVVVLLPRACPGYRPSITIEGTTLRAMGSYSFLNYLTLLFWGAPVFVLPLIVLNRIGAEANAYFFVALSMAGLVWAIPAGVSTSLLVEGSHDPRRLRQDLIRSVGIICAFLVLAVLLVWVLGRQLLLVFGRGYSDEGFWVLRIVSLCAFPMAVNYLYIAVRRVEKRMVEPVMLTVGIALATITLAYFLLPGSGIRAPGLALLAAHAGAAVWALPELLRRLRKSGTVSR